VRVPHEPFLPSFAAQRDAMLRRFTNAATNFRRCRAMTRRLRRAGIACNDAIFGLNDSGRMTRNRLIAFLHHLREGVSEIYSHPATRRWTGPDAPSADDDPEGELAALIDPEVVATVDRLAIRRVPFAAVAPT